MSRGLTCTRVASALTKPSGRPGRNTRRFGAVLDRLLLSGAPGRPGPLDRKEQRSCSLSIETKPGASPTCSSFGSCDHPLVDGLACPAGGTAVYTIAAAGSGALPARRISRRVACPPPSAGRGEGDTYATRNPDPWCFGARSCGCRVYVGSRDPEGGDSGIDPSSVGSDSDRPTCISAGKTGGGGHGVRISGRRRSEG